ncbi:hypothetical protein GLAREA_03095 [Glarea lozoyensis ATCC 20868]|uniref:Glycoside hydrolase 131 catalytic N-terminal domain-containing protein n=1 Tax=Glarea lozoyensis (strain ATCC 20868 / MF5171) TaxID=1116229 RepID=S3D533_GLAL2|nr:uncharacterized protein GLAREA_03095 [Glarea lozoyensis ATCC 20868]EPE27181.1 hypothetical protein GLAREA_03095 [Glarea lozoyensis ATCC 20868]
MKSAFTSTVLVALLATSTTALPSLQTSTKCPVVLDGRIPKTSPPSTFDTTSSPFNPKYVKSQNLTWAQIIKYPHVEPSKFDKSKNSIPFEVTISDASLFVAGGKLQPGFRRAGLLLGNGSDASNEGVRTFHWSIRQDPRRSMNLTHEYMNVWHEAGDYSSNQWSLNAGAMLAQDKPIDTNVSTVGLDKRLWKVLDRRNNVIWTTRIERDTWQNFGIVMDIPANTLQVLYSEDYEPLRPVTKPIHSDNSGGGQYQIGILKKPTETETVVFDGFQENNIDEGQIYGGIFIEDSSKGCTSR